MSALFQLSMWIRVCAQISTLFQYLGYSAVCEMTLLVFFVLALPWLFNRKRWNTSLGLLCHFCLGNAVLRTDTGTGK